MNDNDCDTVFSGDWLLRDADEGEHATAGGKRWTEGFWGRRAGHNQYSQPMFAVTATVAAALADWSHRYRGDLFTQYRRWHHDDQHARHAVESASALYTWDGHWLSSQWRSQRTGQTHYGTAMQLPNGLHLVDGHPWTWAPAELVDLIHGSPADLPPPLLLRLWPQQIRRLAHLTGQDALICATDDGAPIHVQRTGPPAERQPQQDTSS